MTTTTESLPTHTSDQKELRTFGLMMALMLVLIFGFVIPWIWDFDWPIWPWIAAAVFVLAALIAPKLLGPVFTGWMKFATVLAWINTRLILGLAFYVVIFPIGILSRVFRKDPLGRTYDKNAETYRVEKTDRDIKHMEKPY